MDRTVVGEKIVVKGNENQGMQQNTDVQTLRWSSVCPMCLHTVRVFKPARRQVFEVKDHLP